MDLNLVQLIALYAVPVILAITLHEAAHGYVAMRFGDMTAHAAGRVSLNPVRHIDLVGTIAVPLALLALAKIFSGSGILFGWAKPVPVNFANLTHPKRDMLWVAAAGPLINFVMALGWGALAKIGLLFPQTGFTLTLVLMSAAGVFVNVIIMVLNLMPLPPLDGGRIMVSLLPHRLAYRFARIEPFGFIILLVLLFTGVLNTLIWPFVSGAMDLISMIFSVPVGQLLALAHAD
ncbi:MAG TPA: site-2 protease family protein [Burkholderiales bacterium]|nr:site-2 protease family protein [Burkholderiales bacterium]